MNKTYKITFFRPLSGERGDVKDINLQPPLKTTGLTRLEAEETKALLEKHLWAHFHIEPEENRA